MTAKCYFSYLYGGHLETCHTYIFYFILIGFLDPENIRLYTKIVFLTGLQLKTSPKTDGCVAILFLPSKKIPQGCIQTTLIDGIALNMGEANDAYLLILKRYHVEVDEMTNYHKHLKQLIAEHLPNAQFVKSFRKNEPDNIVLPKTISKAIDIHPLKNSLLYTLFKVKDPPVVAPNLDF